MKNPLLDYNFLKELDNQRVRTVYAKIISLDLYENPIEEITGKITGGTINIDGNSAVRRTCNLSINTEEGSTITDFYWTLRTKFKAFIGLKNEINSDYPEIIWFPMGIYVITTFNYSHLSNKLSINISGKDKMSLLNGDLAGLFPISVNLSDKEEIVATYEPGEPDIQTTDTTKLYCDTDSGKYWKYDIANSEWVEAKDTDLVKQVTKVKIRDLIYNLLLSFGNERKENIIINDLDEKAVELLSYKDGESPMYYFKKNQEYENPTLDGDTIVWLKAVVTNANWYYDITNKTQFDKFIIFSLPKEKSSYLWTTKTFANVDKDVLRAPIKIKYLQENMKLYLFAEKDSDKKCYAIYTKDGLTNLSENGMELSGKSLDDAVGYVTFHFEQASNSLAEAGEPTKCYVDEQSEEYRTIFKIVGGKTVGYRETEFVYPGDLISAVGESVVSILDKIKKVLNDFEYFYDTNGRFVFQKKKIYINTAYSPLVKEEDNVDIGLLVDATSVQYSFKDNLLISATSTPVINNLRNDFSIWGTKKSTSGATVPFHMRYAIHNKPVYYKTYKGEVFFTEDYFKLEPVILENKDLDILSYAYDINGNQLYTTDFYKKVGSNELAGDNWAVSNKTPVDWREIIYQMALDYQNNSNKSDFIQTLIINNKDFYPTGVTSYESFYDDMVGYWRTIYNPDGSVEDGFSGKENGYYFHDYVINSPQQLLFWLDFLDTYGDIGKYSIKNVGARQKATNDKDITAVYYDEPPSVMFFNPNETIGVNSKSLEFDVRSSYSIGSDGLYKQYEVHDDNNSDIRHLFYVKNDEVEEESQWQSDGYIHFQLPTAFESLFVVSAQGKTAKAQIDEWLYNYANMTESISVNAVPVYYLSPNTIITINDERANISGEFTINKLTYNFNYNGNMVISANKLIKRLY